ncbi:DUF6371 domain-containing protein [Pontibacter silvestris]|uniref:DUF6371 domain-containing protein n=1 Tax=Pontibacter silvestris TaxID=2305183 RepID=A0ABW4X153_9BACT|nr:DUF6371 domain-containing protein [Pontibacter silvestris]MCC9138715.1 DUF6371 domain-containing protein [Pontibacter silvestris]
MATKSNTGQQPVSYVSLEKLRESRRCYGQNNFVRFLISKVGAETANKLISLYHIGTSKRWPGATVFWQIDQHGKIRTGKIMLYNAVSGKRVTEPKDHIDWAHKYLGQENYYLRQCLFGEHLLRQFPDRPVAVVESEKTATVCTAYLPEYVWLATGSKGNLSRERCLVLRGRNVTLFPDLNGYTAWKAKAEEMADITCFTVSEDLERIATDEQKNEGLDLADFL